MDNLVWEKTLIGTLLAEPRAFTEAEVLIPSDFSGANQVIWAEMMALSSRGGLELRALANALETSPDYSRILSDVGNLAAYLEDALRMRGTAVGEYVDRVLDGATRKAVRRNAALIAAEADNDTQSATEILDYAERTILAIRRNRIEQGMTMADLFGIFMPRLDGYIAGTIHPAWVPDVQALRDIVHFAEETEFVTIAGRPGDGKCLGRGTKVIMHDGSMKNVEDVREGDLLMGPNSLPRKVLSTTSGRAMMYWVRQNRGIDYRVNENHVLSLKRSKNEWSKKHGEIQNVPVKDILNKKKGCSPIRWKGYKVPIELPEKEVKLEPYFLGLWLGDGSRTTPGITTPDFEVTEYLQDYANRRGDQLHVHKMVHSITRRRGYVLGKTIRGLLRKYGVLNDKHIPSEYLQNSRKVRMELLAGLIDSDGSKTHNGIEISMVKPVLIRQIKWLADSLGFRASFHRPRTVKCQTGATATVYRTVIHGDFAECPIRVKRKIPTNIYSRVDKTMTGISIEPDKVDEYFGFELDGDGLFLLEDMTVTHNSSFLRFEAYQAVIKGIPVLLFNMENDPMEYARHFIALHTGIDSARLKNPTVLTFDELSRVKQAGEELSSLPLKLITLASPSVHHIARVARRQIAEDKAKLVMVDYLQLIRNGLENRVADISETTAILRGLALQMHTPVIAAAQLSREIERRGISAEPQLADLRDSGSIEQDSTIVSFIRQYWHDTNHPKAGMFRENLNTDGKVLPRPKAVPIALHVLKNRNGEVGISTPIKWLKSVGRFETLALGTQVT